MLEENYEAACMTAIVHLGTICKTEEMSVAIYEIANQIVQDHYIYDPLKWDRNWVDYALYLHQVEVPLDVLVDRVQIQKKLDTYRVEDYLNDLIEAEDGVHLYDR